jgi:3-hydroxyacyl-CoA dehydrogenase
LVELGAVTTGAVPDRLKFSNDLESAVEGAQLVQENGPERLDFKKTLYGQLDAWLPPTAIIASSSSGLTMSEIQSGCPEHPERCVIGHPFNPPHLIPLVEIVGGAKTSEHTIQRVTDFYTALGKRTIRLHKEVPGHVANRLQAALWREIAYLISEGVVSVADADTAVSWGPGLRWGVMGPTLLFHLGGGQGGIEHFFDQFTGPMTAWWKVLGNPQITPQLRQTVTAGVLEEAGKRSVDALAAERDHVLLGLLKLRAQA